MLILLVTHNRGRMPVTLRSRCQHWRLDLPDRDSGGGLAASSRGWPKATSARYLDYAGGDAELALELEARATRPGRPSSSSNSAPSCAASSASPDSDRMLASFRSRHFTPADRNDAGRLLLSRQRYRCGGQSARRIRRSTARTAVAGFETSGTKAIAQVEENNLDLRLQLEDVLISMKQILTRRSI